MALREFIDKRGVKWKAWDISPDSVHPVTRLEFVVGEFQDGWLAFESAHERRRVADYPGNWMELPDADLEELCALATPIPPPEIVDRTGEFRRMVESETLAREEHERRSPTETHTVRTFPGPGSREWMVTVLTLGTLPGSKKVLRFTANDGTVRDLTEWPDDWHRLTDEQLLAMAKRADQSGQDRETPARRRQDRSP